jgi:hypothetical protein
MAAKLASLTKHNELLVSERFFKRLKADFALKSCGCPSGTKSVLWTEIDLQDDSRFDFSKAYRLGSNWCAKHGREYCNALLQLDQQT